MLGINGQAKTILQRGTDVQKEKTKLPAISPIKVVHKAKNSAKPKSLKSTGTSITKATSTAKTEPKQAEIAQSILEVAKLRLSLPGGSVGDTGTVKIRFNHYNKSFPIHNGVLLWADVDEEYCLSFVYKGNYTRNLALASPGRIDNGASDVGSGTCTGHVDKTHNIVDDKYYAKHDEQFTYYIDIVDKSEYILEVIEDPIAGIGAEGLRLNSGPLKSSELKNMQPIQAIQSTSKAMDTITAELKSIAVTELNDSYARDLIERRDLEDILYS